MITSLSAFEKFINSVFVLHNSCNHTLNPRFDQMPEWWLKDLLKAEDALNYISPDVHLKPKLVYSFEELEKAVLSGRYEDAKVFAKQYNRLLKVTITDIAKGYLAFLAGDDDSLFGYILDETPFELPEEADELADLLEAYL